MADPELLPLQADEPHPLPWHADLHASMARRIGEGRFPHASLLTGPAGVGKTQLAIALASLLVCDAPVEQGLALWPVVSANSAGFSSARATLTPAFFIQLTSPVLCESTRFGPWRRSAWKVPRWPDAKWR